MATTGAGPPIRPRRGSVSRRCSKTRQGDAVESRWRLHAGEVTVEVTYVFRLWNKSLVMDVLASGGLVAEVRYGRAVGLADPRLVTNPFYPAEGGRPAVMVSGTEDQPLFLTGNTDWYRSNGSILWAANSIAANGVVYNGGTRYIPLTNGKRNDCFERFFITVSPRYEEMLPNIPNPPSPWRHITGTRLWRAHGASNREQDRQYWANVHRHGMTQMVVTDHEGMWRDEGESFTSEGNYHSFYMGLTDGNYGQDQSYRPAENPWLVDFDLRKMHDLGCNFGMGSLDMFTARPAGRVPV